jgi:hypothetical protein
MPGVIGGIVSVLVFTTFESDFGPVNSRNILD